MADYTGPMETGAEESARRGGSTTKKLSTDWYCPVCKDYVSGESVTFEEIHVVCGTFIGETWQKIRRDLKQQVERLENIEKASKLIHETSGPGLYGWQDLDAALAFPTQQKLSEEDMEDA